MSIKKNIKSHSERKNEQSHSAWLLRKQENAKATSNVTRRTWPSWILATLPK